LLDLFCGAGGAAMGYHRAGFQVVGVDKISQYNYPFEFHKADALSFPLDGFDAIHASPPCQAYTQAQSYNYHPDLVGPVRDRLVKTEIPWVIENVVGAPLHDPIMLCGAMFPGLRVYRHRLFESNFEISIPEHPWHKYPQTKMGRPPKENEFMHIVGHWSGVEQGRKAMGIDWMTGAEMTQAIPPVYTEYIGRQLWALCEDRWWGC
jgi:DNA (cytosine-5)-methyltransferase 1